MNSDLKGKRVIILGFARQGQAFARFAAEEGARVLVTDSRNAADFEDAIQQLADLDIDYVFGEHPFGILDGADLLVISGGVPLDLPIVEEARSRGISLTNDSLEFMKRVRATTIGITGSAGKSTTTALTGQIVKTSGRQTWIGGNIGNPLISNLGQIEDQDVVVQELSSFQLELWDVSPPVAAILNVTPNHLDRHPDMDSYRSAKANIIRFQNREDVAVLSADDAGAKMVRDVVKSRLRQFSLHIEVEDGAFVRAGKLFLRDMNREVMICSLDEIPLRGMHNVSNVLASAILADSVGVQGEVIQAAIREFHGVEHRLELVRTVDGVQYVNDSIATSPERAMAALEAYSEPIILIAGGRDKNMEWEGWAQKVKEQARIAILFGELAGMMETLINQLPSENDGALRQVIEALSLPEAVDLASELARPGDVVLLAPGGTSFDAYADFTERGKHFRLLVGRLRSRTDAGLKLDNGDRR